MTYPVINGTLAKQDLTYFFIYADIVTNGLFSLFLVVGFFLVVFLGSLFMQFRYTTKVRPEISLLASSFATLGWVTILEMKTGLLNPIYFISVIGITILAFIWASNSD